MDPEPIEPKPARSPEHESRYPVPAVHLPYVITVGLFGIMSAAGFFLDAADALIVAIQALVCVGVLVLHFVWFHALFKDGERALGEKLPLDARRAVIVMFFACPFLLLWTVAAIGALLRCAQESVGDRDVGAGRMIARAARDTRPLFWVLALYLMVIFVFFVTVAADAEDQGLSSSEITATDAYMSEKILLAIFQLVTYAYYLTFATRAVPALYRGWNAV